MPFKKNKTKSCDHQAQIRSSHTPTTTCWHKPVCSASMWESPFLHTDARVSAVSFCAIINSKSQIHKTVICPPSPAGFFPLFQMSQNRKTYPGKRFQGYSFFSSLIKQKHSRFRFGIFFYCAANAHRLVVTLSVRSRSKDQEHSVASADDRSAITDIFNSHFSLEKPLRNNDLCEQKIPPPYIRQGQALSLSLSPSQLLRSTAQLSALYGLPGRQVGGASSAMTPSPTHSFFWQLQGRINQVLFISLHGRVLDKKTKHKKKKSTI